MASRPSISTTSSSQSAATVLGSPSILTDYEPLEIIGNGSFGIIRKVRRKSDGVLLARKELNFERMTERDRKQIVAEVNILKELQHDNIVRYHDRFVDREHGILYILMEYCGGGDLSGIIKQSRKLKQPVPEDTIWAYLTQLLYALHYCHHPGVPLPVTSGAQGGDVAEGDWREGKQVILHRDLKPENVFLDANGSIKLGDFGLSKAISSSTFANTYVGTPYYMSPELINDSPYDTKSDIWALGCLLYELCAWNPPFHAAQTHQELAVHIRSGRYPPLPKQYSSTLVQVIKAMLTQAPHARPSAQMLMTHEKIVHSHKVLEAQKM
ncbi:kinase-like protein [Calocera cornea HHB12733]|uniref:non-specific serine/threonine protein kinase n=1 Tax=Calocera cornea HHB12733 TaxID=1353952 RepID=A0A165JLK6_9BASI|nr:kinase-like protein [Calocera cornea HHB12733]